MKIFKIIEAALSGLLLAAIVPAYFMYFEFSASKFLAESDKAIWLYCVGVILAMLLGLLFNVEIKKAALILATCVFVVSLVLINIASPVIKFLPSSLVCWGIGIGFYVRSFIRLKNS